MLFRYTVWVNQTFWTTAGATDFGSKGKCTFLNQTVHSSPQKVAVICRKSSWAWSSGPHLLTKLFSLLRFSAGSIADAPAPMCSWIPKRQWLVLVPGSFHSSIAWWSKQKFLKLKFYFKKWNIIIILVMSNWIPRCSHSVSMAGDNMTLDKLWQHELISFSFLFFFFILNLQSDCRVFFLADCLELTLQAVQL